MTWAGMGTTEQVECGGMVLVRVAATVGDDDSLGTGTEVGEGWGGEEWALRLLYQHSSESKGLRRNADNGNSVDPDIADDHAAAAELHNGPALEETIGSAHEPHASHLPS